MAGVSVVRELDARDLASAVGILARGMRDNPLHIAALGTDAEARGVRLIAMFTVALPAILAKGVVLGVFDGDVLVGVAGILAPGRCQRSLTEKLTVLPRIFPAIGTGGFVRVGQWMGAWARHDLAEPHWHLGPVAVDRHLQGRGIGSVLMAEYCARLDRLNAVGYLETDRLANVMFYERFGFQTTGTAAVLNTPNWFMRRPAQRAASRSVVSCP